MGVAQAVNPLPCKRQPAYIQEAQRLIQRLGDPSKAIRYALRKGASRESINYMIREYNRTHHTKYTLNDWKKQAELHSVTLEQGFLTKVEERPLFNYTRDLGEIKKLLSDARKEHEKLYGEREEFKYKKENIQMEGINRDLAPPAIQVEQFDESQFKAVSQTEDVNSLEGTTNQSLEETAAVQESTVNKETYDEALQKNDSPGLNQNDMDTTSNVQWDTQAIVQRLDTKKQPKDAQGPKETVDKPRLDSWYVTKAEDTELTEDQGNNLAQTQEKANDGFVWPKWFHADYQQDKLSQSLGYENFDKLKEKAKACGEKNGVHYYANEDLKTGKIVIWKDKNYEKVAEFPDKQKWQELTQAGSWGQMIQKGITKPEHQPGSERSRGMELNR